LKNLFLLEFGIENFHNLAHTPHAVTVKNSKYETRNTKQKQRKNGKQAETIGIKLQTIG